MNSWAGRERVDQLLILDPDAILLYVPKLIQFLSINPNNTYRYDTPGILACEHGSDSCLTAALGKQLIFSGTSDFKINSFNHYQSIAYPLEFETSFWWLDALLDANSLR